VDLYYNGNTVPMLPMGGDRYYAIVSGVPHGTRINYYIFATDTSGNVAYWPAQGDSEQLRVALTNWLGSRPFYVVAFVKLLVTRRPGRSGPAGSFFFWSL
jgi:hypothetical protein